MMSEPPPPTIVVREQPLPSWDAVIVPVKRREDPTLCNLCGAIEPIWKTSVAGIHLMDDAGKRAITELRRAIHDAKRTTRNS